MGFVNLLVVLLLLFLIGQITIRITVIYHDTPEVWVGLLFFNFKVVPGKKKPIKTKDFKIKRFRKMRLKERAKEREKERRAAEKKAAKKAKKAEKKAKKAEEKKRKDAPKKSIRQIVSELRGKLDFGLSLARGVVFPLVKRFSKSLRADVYRIHLIIATGDAAKTATTYGIACAAVADLLELLGKGKLLTYKKGAIVKVTPDFVSEKSRIDVKIRLRLRIRHILALPFGAIGDFIKVMLSR